MDQQKIGRFLKQLRNENGLTQQQLAEWLGVSDRSVSRWENGVTLPDFDLLLQLADRYGVEVREVLDGQRKPDADSEAPKTDPATRQALLQAADYHNQEKLFFTRRLRWLLWVGLAAQLASVALVFWPLPDAHFGDLLGGFCQGIVLGALLVGLLFSTRWMGRIRAAKLRLLQKLHLRKTDAE